MRGRAKVCRSIDGDHIVTNTNIVAQSAAAAVTPAQFDQLRSNLHRGAEWAYLHLIHPTETYTAKDGTEKPRSISLWYPADQPLAIPAWAEGWNVYFGVHGAAQKGEQWQRTAIREGKASPRVSVINSLFGDFDFKDFSGSKSATMEHILSLPIMPSALIETGGGYHAYWLLDEPFYLDSEEATARAKSIQYRWCELVKSDNGAKDLTRILRVPGSTNHKAKYAPDFPTVGFVSSRIGKPYPLAEIEALLPPEPEPAPKRVYENLPTSEIEKALSFCSNVTGYNDKLSILMALHNEFGDAGIPLAEQYIGPNWSPDNGETIAQKFASFSDSGAVGIGTLFYHAAQHGYERSEDIKSFVPSEAYQTRQQLEQLITDTRLDVREEYLGNHVPKHLHAQYQDGRTVYRTTGTDKAVASAFLDLCQRQGSTEIHASSRELAKLAGLGAHQTAINALNRLAGWFVEKVETDTPDTRNAPMWRLIWTPASRLDSITKKDGTTVSNLETSDLFGLYKSADPFMVGRSKTAQRLENEIKPLGRNALLIIDALTDSNGQTRAGLAESCGITRSSVSAAVRKLRDYFGLVCEDDERAIWLEPDWLDALGVFVPKMTTYKLSLEREDRHIKAQVAYADKLLAQPTTGPEQQVQLMRRKRRLMAERIAIIEQLHEDWTGAQVERYMIESYIATGDRRQRIEAGARREREEQRIETFDNNMLIKEAQRIMAEEDAAPTAPTPAAVARPGKPPATHQQSELMETINI